MFIEENKLNLNWNSEFCGFLTCPIPILSPQIYSCHENNSFANMITMKMSSLPATGEGRTGLNLPKASLPGIVIIWPVAVSWKHPLAGLAFSWSDSHITHCKQSFSRAFSKTIKGNCLTSELPQKVEQTRSWPKKLKRKFGEWVIHWVCLSLCITAIEK